MEGNDSIPSKVVTGPVREFFTAIRFLNTYHRYSVKGAERIPKKGRGLILVNHGLATYDILLFGMAIRALTGRAPRGLGHKNFFWNKTIGKWSSELGIVSASPGAGNEILNNDHLVLLAPGGMWEALRSSEEKHQIRWHERFGFAKLALTTQSPVILAVCPAADEMYSVTDTPLTQLLYKQFKLPFILPRGFGISLLPKPVRLTHYVRAPIIPPTFKGDEPDKELVQSFQNHLVKEMEKWMQEHV